MAAGMARAVVKFGMAFPYPGNEDADPAARHLPEDAFGDPFDLDDLPLPRPAGGYAVQKIGTDQLLDRMTGDFLPVRDARLDALHPSFDAARAAARAWCRKAAAEGDPALAIVPAAYDEQMRRHVLIYGVIPLHP